MRSVVLMCLKDRVSGYKPETAVKYLKFIVSGCKPETTYAAFGFCSFGLQIRNSVLGALFLLIVAANSGFAQNNFEASGFFEYLNNTWAPENSGRWTNISGLYNRLDIHWYPANTVEFRAGVRNNFNFGPMMAGFYPFYTDILLKDYGYVDMTFKIAKDTSYLFYTNIDRLYFKYTIEKFEITVGRQRINWGMNLIWNPNDIFNTYNYFDFDYVERPGSDAVLIQYYTGDFSSVQLAVKADNNKKLTLAAMYKFNLSNYDVQFLGGVMKEDVVMGMGWSGQIGGAGFTGEVSYFRDKDNFGDTTGQFVASVSANYTFENSLFINGSLLYNSKGTTGNAGMGAFLFLGNMSPKTLSLSRCDIFGEVSYPVTPLIKADLSSIFNPYDKSLFVGPSLDFSLTGNLDFLIMAQIFSGKRGTEFGDYGQMYYVRLKWSF